MGTVSNVLNRPDKVAPATAARVQASIDRLGFIRNDAARQLRAGHSRTIGLVVLDIRNPFFTEVARGAEQRAAEHGLTVLVANSDEKLDRENTNLELFEEQRVFGVLMTPVSEDLERVRKIRQRGIPTVLVDRLSHDNAFSSVAVDDIAGGSMAADHLLALGRRRIAFVGGPVSIRQVGDRLEGAQASTTAAGASLEFIATTALSVEEGRRVGDQISARDAADRPDAIFAANDLVALGLLQSLVMHGQTRIPEDIALIGYDDIDFSSAAVIPLSSIRQPAALIGSRAVDLLLHMRQERVEVDEHIVFTPELVVRASTAPAD